MISGFSHFTDLSVMLLGISLFLLLLACLVFDRRSKTALSLLALSCLGLGLFMATLDPFLNLWDEQYHALVAKNLADHWLKPMLYTDPLLEYDMTYWTMNHIWLHKQPLFLWQMALSIKIFGASEFAVRLPSVIMHAILPIFVYRIGRIAASKETGFYAALLVATAHFPLELVAGKYSTDHNDVAFLFYVTASFWSWFEFSKSGKKRWLLLIELFSGGAVLTKWLMGLVVFVIWTLVLARKQLLHKRIVMAEWKAPISAGLISLCVFLPWQIYIHNAFPEEAAFEMSQISNHLFHPVENHSESTWYYFTEGFSRIYGSGDLIPFIALCGLILFIRKICHSDQRWFIGLSVGFVYLFYTLAATKMVSFPIIAGPFIYLGFGCLIHYILCRVSRVGNRYQLIAYLKPLLLFLICIMSLRFSKIERYHTMKVPTDNYSRQDDLAEMKLIRLLKGKLKNGDYVVFNTTRTLHGHVPTMFYTDMVAYPFIPSQAQTEMLLLSGRPIAVISFKGLPDYLTKNPSIHIIDFQE
jgi:4-amino-4-deoxy-L-arabinose transferase